MNDQMSVLKRNYLPSDLAPFLAQLNFDGCIAVQARQSIEETRWLLELSEGNDFVRGVVGWLDLCSPQLSEQLERFAHRPRLLGVRHVVQDEPDDEFMLRPVFLEGISQLREFGLTYDLLLYPKHLPVAVRLVEQFPDQAFVLDHIAKPPIAAAKLSPWGEDLHRLAEFPNVYCKLSGMVTEANWKTWKPEDFHPYLDVVVEAFGTSRLMIGSDWPVCTVSSDYVKTMQLVLDYISRFTTGEQNAILGDNCAEFYGIPSPRA